MAKDYEILLKKTGGAVKNSNTDFGIVCTEVPFMLNDGTKDVVVRDWADEHGEDAYIPQELKQKPYDLEISICYKGTLGKIYTNLRAFEDYMTGADGNGAELQVYIPHLGFGRQKVYYKGLSDAEFYKTNSDVLTATLTLRITDPVTDITL